MYVKVRKKANQWFRIDNGTLVGTEISRYSHYYKLLSQKVGNQIFIKNNNNETKTIYYGHFVNNKFVRLSICEKCSDKSCGYYAFVLG